jgi:oligopeptide/dipeptide ABC transporter ATP-binding protein
MPLLEIQDLAIDFTGDRETVRAVDGVSLCVDAGETLALVGESGSGKSVAALAVGRLLASPPARYAAGSIRLEGREVFGLPERELRSLRGAVVSYVFQEPAAALNPVMRVGTQVLEALKLHRPSAATVAEVATLLRLVGIPAPDVRARDYPHQLSGGMQQRVIIAMALASHPKLLIADEPTTALDVTIQAQIIELLRDLQRQMGMAILLITHNLGLVGDIARRIAVMYAGQIVETGPTGKVLQHPLHPYTHALLKAVPVLGAGRQRLAAIPGNTPSPGEFPTGCRFHPRCSHAVPDCARRMPALETVAGPTAAIQEGATTNARERQVRCPVTITTGLPAVPTAAR